MLSSISTSSTSVQASPLKAPDAAQVFKRLDQDNKGYLTESDLTSAVVNISPEGTQRAQQAQGDAETKAKEAFAKMDSDGDGQLTQSEFEAAAPPSPPSDTQANATQAAAQAPSGAPPAGGGGGAPGAGAASSSEQTYDPADTNEDGTVSEQEQLIYEAKQAAAKAQSASQDHAKEKTGATTGKGDPAKDRQALEAVNTYEAVASAA